MNPTQEKAGTDLPNLPIAAGATTSPTLKPTPEQMVIELPPSNPHSTTGMDNNITPQGANSKTQVQDMITGNQDILVLL